MKILVLGCKGQLGRCLDDQLVNTDHEVIYTSREQIDIADFEVTKNKILEFSPDLIINATAYTAVDKAEEDQKNASLINHLAVKNIADICSQEGCWLIHISTDYVFDGSGTTPWSIRDTPNPKNAYGRSKLKGEWAIKASGCAHAILRTSWVISAHGNNFVKTMRRLSETRDYITVVDDQIGGPTPARDIAMACLQIAEQLTQDPSKSGTYHFSGAPDVSWADFAREIFDQARKSMTVTPIPTTDYPTRAQRPLFATKE